MLWKHQIFTLTIAFLISICSLAVCHGAVPRILHHSNRIQDLTFLSRTARFPWKATTYNGTTCSLVQSVTKITRGGSSEDEDEDSEYDNTDDDQEEEEDATAIGSTSTSEESLVSKTAKIFFSLASKVAISTGKALSRAFQAMMEQDEDAALSEEEPASMVQKVLSTTQRMVKAAFSFPSEDEEESEEEDDECMEAQTGIKSSKAESQNEAPMRADDKEKDEDNAPPNDFGTFLGESYDVQDERDSSGPAILGGSLQHALETAHAEAKLLVVFIPSNRPHKKSIGADKDAIAIEGLLSAKVAAAANKRARPKGEETGSFLFWGAKAGSSEATKAIKKLKAETTSSKGKKAPVLAVVYPRRVKTNKGAKMIAPKMLVQHHCTPPPPPGLMAEWLNAWRKRAVGQYIVLQKEMKELEYSVQRQEGYQKSVIRDTEKRVLAAEEKARVEKEEEAQKQRQLEMTKRRDELRESLPEECSNADAMRVSLRFADGKAAQRSFSPDEKLEQIFNWVDVEFEIERETVILTTMNGRQQYTWDESKVDETLAVAGLSKLNGFRVTIQQKEDSTSEEDATENHEEEE